VNFGDLRGTAVTRLALSGCTVPEICAITGHSHAEANATLEAHYLHRDPRNCLERHPQARGARH
jgi:hypothetical protein